MPTSFSRGTPDGFPDFGVVFDFVLSVALSVAKGILREGESLGAAGLSGVAPMIALVKPGFSPAHLKSSKFGVWKGDFGGVDASFSIEILSATPESGLALRKRLVKTARYSVKDVSSDDSIY